MARSRIERAVMRRRRAVNRVHRWTSLVLVTWVIMQAFTGAVMLIGDQINTRTHPGLFDHGQGDMGADAAVAAAKTTLPSASARQVFLPSVERGVYRVAMVVDPKAGKQRWVYVDPASARVTGVRDPEGGFVAWASRWHDTLLQDKPILGVKPRQVVGWLGVATIGVLLMGLYLWYWPRVQRWRSLRRVRLRRGKYIFHGDLHRFVGVLAAPVLLVILVAGANIAFRDQLRSFWYSVTPGADSGPVTPTPPPKSTAKADKPVTVAALVETAKQAVPDGSVESLTLGGKPDGAASVKVRSGYDPSTGPEGRGGNVTVFVDQFDGHVLKISRPSDKPIAAQAYEVWSFPLHTGTFGALPTRLLWLLASAAPLTLMITGLSTTLIRRGKRRRRLKAVRRALPLLTRDQATAVTGKCAVRDFKPDDTIVRQGAAADSFFVIVSGDVSVFVEDAGGRHLARVLGGGDSFGEIGLLDGGRRTASVIATSEGEVLVLSRSGFDELVSASATTHQALVDVSDQRLASDALRDSTESTAEATRRPPPD